MTTKTKSVAFWNDRYPSLLVTTPHGRLQFHDGVAEADDPDLIEAVRSISAQHGINEGKRPADHHEDVVSREIAEPIPEQVVDSRPLAFTPDDVARAPESFSDQPYEDVPAASLQGTVPSGDRPTHTERVKGTPESPRREEPSKGSPKATKPGRPPTKSGSKK